MKLIDAKTCHRLLQICGMGDNAADMQSIVYYFDGDDNIVVILQYKGMELKATITELDFVDEEMDGIKNRVDFVNFVLQPPFPVLRILGEEKEDREIKLKITTDDS